MSKPDYQRPIQEAVAVCDGNIAELARRLGISRAAVAQWKRIPAERVLDVERVTAGRVSRYDQRPDIYGPRIVSAGEAA